MKIKTVIFMTAPDPIPIVSIINLDFETGALVGRLHSGVIWNVYFYYLRNVDGKSKN